MMFITNYSFKQRLISCCEQIKSECGACKFVGGGSCSAEKTEHP